MKRILSISTIGIAIAALMLFTLIRHHHHQGRICFEIQHCCAGGEAEEGNHEAHGDCVCILSVDYTVPNAGMKCKASCCHNPEHHPHPQVLELFATADDFRLFEELHGKYAYIKHVFAVPLSAHGLSHGLRAPPILVLN